MNAKVTVQEPEFKPVEITFALETKEELDAFVRFIRFTPVHDWMTDRGGRWIGDMMYSAYQQIDQLKLSKAIGCGDFSIHQPEPKPTPK